MGEATNKQLRVLVLISIGLILVAIVIMIWGPKTILLESDSSGKIMAGTMKQHIPFTSKSSEELEDETETDDKPGDESEEV